MPQICIFRGAEFRRSLSLLATKCFCAARWIFRTRSPRDRPFFRDYLASSARIRRCAIGLRARRPWARRESPRTPPTWFRNSPPPPPPPPPPPRIPDKTDHSARVEGWGGGEQQSGEAPCCAKELPVQAWLLYRLRLLWASYACKAFDDFGGICAQCNLLSAVLNLAATDGVGLGLAFFSNTYHPFGGNGAPAGRQRRRFSPSLVVGTARRQGTCSSGKFSFCAVRSPPMARRRAAKPTENLPVFAQLSLPRMTQRRPLWLPRTVVS